MPFCILNMVVYLAEGGDKERARAIIRAHRRTNLYYFMRRYAQWEINNPEREKNLSKCIANGS
jgi:hypothetical protein